MKKKIIIICIAILITALVTTIILNFNNIFYKATNLEKTENVEVFATINDTVTADSTWCGIFQLVWNDMQNELVGGNVKFQEPNVMVDNLNKQAFKESDLSEEYYYKNFGIMSKELKQEIEKGIEEKFAEKSDILDLFEWPEVPTPDRYFFYSMLKRDFEFENEFKVLDNKNFAQTENVEYFGVDSNTAEEVRNQVSVLYYNSDTDFAVTLQTKQGDEVTLVRAPTGENFEEILENVERKESKYNGSETLNESDTLSIPNLNINALKEYTELENKEFTLKTKEIAYIKKAIQTIKFKLDNKGGEIKSEAGMVVQKAAILESRNFDFNDNFAIFLKEEDKDLPYFAAVISDINLFK